MESDRFSIPRSAEQYSAAVGENATALLQERLDDITGAVAEVRDKFGDLDIKAFRVTVSGARDSEIHQDRALDGVTLVVTLTAHYTGGGTAFYTAVDTSNPVLVLRPGIGHVVVFDPLTWHSGIRVYEGTRYIMVVSTRPRPRPS